MLHLQEQDTYSDIDNLDVYYARKWTATVRGSIYFNWHVSRNFVFSVDAIKSQIIYFLHLSQSFSMSISIQNPSVHHILQKKP